MSERGRVKERGAQDEQRGLSGERFYGGFMGGSEGVGLKCWSRKESVWLAGARSLLTVRHPHGAGGDRVNGPGFCGWACGFGLSW